MELTTITALGSALGIGAIGATMLSTWKDIRLQQERLLDARKTEDLKQSMTACSALRKL